MDDKTQLVAGENSAVLASASSPNVERSGLSKALSLYSATILRIGAITSQPVLGGLHHHYCRI